MWTVVPLLNTYIYSLSAVRSLGIVMGPAPFTEVALAEDAQGPEEQALCFQAGGDPLRQDAMMDSPERQPPEKTKRCDGELCLAETARGFFNRFC